MCCSVLQCIAVCGVLSMRKNSIPKRYTIYNILQRTATHCNTLQHTATHINTFDAEAGRLNPRKMSFLQHTATTCNTLQRTATHCHTLQHYKLQPTATYYNTATHYNTFPKMVNILKSQLATTLILTSLTISNDHRANFWCFFLLNQKRATGSGSLPIRAKRMSVRVCAARVTSGSPTQISVFNSLQHTATHCNTLQHTATHCVRQGRRVEVQRRLSPRDCIRVHCIILQHVATHCNTLQHTATHCNTHA